MYLQNIVTIRSIVQYLKTTTVGHIQHGYNRGADCARYGTAVMIVVAESPQNVATTWVGLLDAANLGLAAAAGCLHRE